MFNYHHTEVARTSSFPKYHNCIYRPVFHINNVLKLTQVYSTGPSIPQTVRAHKERQVPSGPAARELRPSTTQTTAEHCPRQLN